MRVDVRVVAKAQEPSLVIERTGDKEIYSGRIVQELYPQVENPKIVAEKTPESDSPQRVLYGTLDKGEIYVVWNL